MHSVTLSFLLKSLELVLPARVTSPGPRAIVGWAVCSPYLTSESSSGMLGLCMGDCQGESRLPEEWW